ncbi:MAG: hypothetical protein ACRDSJ_02525, partial [Rubrobacteraceae bacterium]
MTITASDGEKFSQATFTLTVNNVAPTTVWDERDPKSVWESDGTNYGFQFKVTEPGEDTTSPNVSCGSRGTVAGVWQTWSVSSPDSGYVRTYNLECRFADGPASSTISASATDSDGATGNTATMTAQVENHLPTATLNAPTSINEGGTATVTFTNQNDVQADRNAGFRYAFACNGASLDGATYDNSGTGTSTTCAYGDNGPMTDKGTPSPYTVRARIIDKDDGFTEYTKNITVNNVAPTATLEAPNPVRQGDNFTVSLTNVFDPSSADRQSLTYAFDCGDGSGYGAATGQASRSCLALDKPTMTIKGKVMDKDGGVNEYTREISVNNIAPTGTVKINNNAAATNSRTVNLALSATDPLPGSGVGHMRFRNENTDTWS